MRPHSFPILVILSAGCAEGTTVNITPTAFSINSASLSFPIDEAKLTDVLGKSPRRVKSGERVWDELGITGISRSTDEIDELWFRVSIIWPGEQSPKSSFKGVVRFPDFDVRGGQELFEENFLRHGFVQAKEPVMGGFERVVGNVRCNAYRFLGDRHLSALSVEKRP